MEKIKSSLKKVNFVDLGTSAILASLGAATSVYLGSEKFQFLGGTPFLIFSAFTFYSAKKYYSQIKEDNLNPKRFDFNSLFFNASYQKAFFKGVKSYIDNSENLKEKQYKIALLNLWCTKNKINIKEHYDSKINEYFNNLYEDFIQKLPPYKYKNYSIYIDSKKIEVESFFSNIEFNIENKNILKKAYHDMKEEGILTYSLFNCSTKTFNLLLDLQDGKLSNKDKQDLANLKKMTNMFYSSYTS